MPRARRVVIVDDHKFLVEMLVGELVERGYEAMYVDVDDPELVAHLRELQPAMILLDAVFRDDEDAGLRVLCELREDHDIEVAIITGVADEIRHAEFLDHGAIAVVSKGNSLETVMDQIGDVLSGIDPHGARQRHDLARKLEQHRSRIADHAKILDDLTSHERSTLQSHRRWHARRSNRADSHGRRVNCAITHSLTISEAQCPQSG